MKETKKMKKLMIAAAIVCAAAFAQAGSFMWGVENVSGYNGESSDGYQAWLIENYTGAVSADNLASIISTYGVEDDWGGIESGATDGSSSDIGADQTVNAFVLVVDADSVDNANHFFVTDTQTTTSNGMAVFDPPSLMFDASSTATASNWQAVPEPTSGLLLLLGVAGLALRRRRA